MQRHIARVLPLSALLVLAVAVSAQGSPIGFTEDWAFATDRAKVLEQLIPGTRDYYYYHCRQYQDTGAFDKVEPLLKAWVQRHGRTSRVIEIENRQALLTFDKDPTATLGFLRRRLGLRFDHQRQMAGAKQKLPSALDPELVSPEAYARRALQRHPRTAAGFNESALDGLLATRLSDDLLLSVLARLRRPDVPNLPALVVRNLGHRRSRGFGSLPIHGKLLRDQLDECVRLWPSLLGERRFVDAYLRRLRPGADVSWKTDAKAREAYLDRLQAFADRLAPAHNSLKAHVLHARLKHDLAAGKPDRARLLAYLRLPRPASYMKPEFLRRHGRSGSMVDLNRGFPTGFGPIGNDDRLVRAYLMHFFATADSYDAYADVLRGDFLRRLFAETKILLGAGDMERWYSLLDDPAYYERLKERVEIEFAPTQKRYFGAADPVSIDVDIKNVKKLLVKIFEINTFNYYRKMNREVDASINLDGLVANHETTREYTDSPLRRVRRHFDLDALGKPGVYVVELIGNGLSSRAVIHKGALQYTERLGAAGHVFTVRDEAGTELAGASIWFGGKTYRADQDGEIVLPYSTKPGRRSLILQHGRLSSLSSFRHRAENYEFSAGIHLDRESLLARHKARILVRPVLRLNGNAVGLAVVEHPVLTIRSRNVEGVEATLEVREFKLFADRESVHEIQVPSGLSTISVSLRGQVRNLSRGQTVDVSTAARTFAINAIDATVKTACPLLGRTSDGYVLDVLGKNGEPKAARPVRLSFRHRDYKDQFTITLKTDARGRITLGELAGITTVHATGLPRQSSYWTLRPAARSFPGELHGVAGQTLRVPYTGSARQVSRAVASLIEQRGGVFVRDAFEHVALAGGFVELRDLPAGDYALWLKEARVAITVRVAAGRREGGWAVGRDRMLELDPGAPLQITGVSAQGDAVQVRLANAGEDARVHVVATRYVAPFSAFDDLAGPSVPAPMWVEIEHPETTYHSGREIGDEYRYILDRRFAQKYPGNMLQRPGLILNPWALDEAWNTAVGLGGGAGGKFGGRGGGRKVRSSASGRGGQGTGAGPGTFANLEFLPHAAVVVANLRPDAKGIVTVPFAKLGDGQLVHVIAVDAEDTVYASFARDEKPLVAKSREQEKALDAKQHFSEQRRIEFVAKGGTATVADVAMAKADTFDSLAAVHRLFSTVSGNADLAKFAFVLEWPKLSDAEKREKYEKYACHELHFFIHQKDPAFFKAVVRPYLANKAHKTFLDEWLLGADLTRYVDPWAFGRLNVFERILLARRLGDAAPAIRRHVREAFELLPRDTDRLARLFDTALQSGALDDVHGLGKKLAEVRKSLRQQQPSPQADPRAPSRSRAPAKKGKSSDAKNAGRRHRLRAGLDKAKVAERAEAKEEIEQAEEEAPEEDAADTLKDRAADLERRGRVRELYRAPDATKPYVEHNYWHRRIREHVASLVKVNGFWRDYAVAPVDRPFVSTNLAEATSSFNEMLLALAVLDLPFEAGKHVTKIEGSRLTMQAASPLLLVRKELVETEGKADQSTPILVSQNYYRLDEPYRFDGNQRYDAYVTEEFLVDVAYGCRVVVTNPTSAPRKLELLMQIPEGSIPVNGGFYTKGVTVKLGAYATSSYEYAFYFPSTGELPHYPVHVSRDGKLVAFAPAQSLNVVAEPSRIDRSSWQFISQNGTTDQVLAYLDTTNLQRTDLSKIAWRMHDKSVFAEVVGKLRERHVYSNVLWSYGIQHGDTATVREYLRYQSRFLSQCGTVLDSPLVKIDPIERHTYEHIEYDPLFNARAHRFGKQRRILNSHLASQYRQFLRVMGDRRKLDDADWMSVTYYLLLQDRVGEALQSFARVRPDALPMRVQYDYMRAYLDFFTEGTDVARTLAGRYRDYPVARWQKLFADIRNQLDEAAGRAVAKGDPGDRTGRQTELAAGEPALELEVEARRVTLRHRNLKSCEVRYYEMDVEFLFSTHPFVQQGSGSFAFIEPNRREVRALPQGSNELAFDLPAEFQNSNVLIEVAAGGLIRRKAYYANSLDVQWIENYGQLQVTHKKTGKPMRTVYVKVFARMPGGRVRFYKDGYTDLRGRFDYASLSEQGSPGVERFALLVMSDENGAVIREVAPPAQ